MRDLLTSLEKAKREALRLQNRMDVIARYCDATEKEVQQLLAKLNRLKE